MVTPRVYFDSCAFIEVAKGKFGAAQTQERQKETDYCGRLLAASRAGEIEVWTSTITVAEACHIGTPQAPQEVRRFFESLLLSGRDGVKVIEPDPFVMMAARDLTWDHGIGRRVADRIHVASAIRAQCTELISIDGELANRLKTAKVQTVRIIPAAQTLCLPDAFRTDDLFGKKPDGS